MKSVWFGSVAAVGLSVATAGAALAQSGGAATDDAQEIIVTAQKRAEPISEVPITITAYSGERLEAIGVSEFDQLSAFVPGLNVQEQSPNNPGFVIRGITSDSGSAQEAARVTIYYNGVDVSRSRGSYFDLFDLERVEVVKGPQATLFGTAASIGAISVISARPRPGTSGEIRAGYGNFDQKLLSGFLNGGSDTFSGRFAFALKQRDGYIRNIAGETGSQTPNGRDIDDLNGQDQLGFRGSLRFTPTDAWTLDLIASHDRQRSPGTAFKSGSLPPTNGRTDLFSFAELGGSPFSRTVLGLDELGLNRDVWDVNLTVRHAPSDDVTITSITGWRDFESLEVFDADGSPAWYLEFAEDAKGWQISHETRVSYEGERFRGFAGFNIFHEQGSQRVPFSTEEGTFIACTRTPAFAAIQAALGNLPCVAPNGTVTAAQATRLLTRGGATAIPYASEFENSGNIETYSAFVDATFLPTPLLELTAGLRVLLEDRRSGFTARQPNSVILAGLGVRTGLLPTVDTRGQTFEAADDFTALLPRFNILYRLTDAANLYATVSKGRRSPVLQLSAASTAAGPVPSLSRIPAEKVWNYEAGLKAAVGGVTGSIAGFYQTYDNFQVSVVEGGRTVTRNAGTATNWGIEAEAAARLGRHVDLFGNVAYTDAGIDDDPQNGIFAGDRFRLQPKWQASAGASFTAPLGGFELFVTPTVSYRSKIYFELPNSELISEEGVFLANLRAGFSAADGRWQLTGFATNLFDKDYVIDAGNTGGSFGYPTFIAGEPRLYGVEATFRF